VDNYDHNPVRHRADNPGDNPLDQFIPQPSTGYPPSITRGYTQLYGSYQHANLLNLKHFSHFSTKTAFPYYYHCY